METKKDRKMVYGAMLAVLACYAVTAGDAQAFTAPVDGDFGFSIYDFLVNKVGKSSIGMSAGVVGFIAAFMMTIRQMFLPALGTAAGTYGMLKAEDMVLSLGSLVDMIF